MLKVEIADTPELQQKGLMYRESLDDDRGMLFTFSDNHILKFWNLNTFIPLDVAFVSNDGVIEKIAYLPSIDIKLSTVESGNPCKMVIEANEGYFSKNGISEGCRINISDNNEETVISFGAKNENNQFSKL